MVPLYNGYAISRSGYAAMYLGRKKYLDWNGSSCKGVGIITSGVDQLVLFEISETSTPLQGLLRLLSFTNIRRGMECAYALPMCNTI